MEGEDGSELMKEAAAKSADHNKPLKPPTSANDKAPWRTRSIFDPITPTEVPHMRGKWWREEEGRKEEKRVEEERRGRKRKRRGEEEEEEEEEESVFFITGSGSK